MLAARANKAHRDEGIALFFLKVASAVFVVTIALLLGYLAIQGTKLFTVDHKSVFEFLFSGSFDPANGKVGAAAFILGSLFVTAFAIVVGGPFGVAVGVFFAELAPKRVAAALKPAIEVLVGIPSVVYGWLGLTLLVPLIRNVTGSSGFGLLAGGIVLSLMILPTVVSLSEDALKVVPGALREGSFALGATRWETISKVLLPAAASGLAVAVILGIALAIGETLALQLVIGNAPIIPTSLLGPAAALTSEIVMDMGGATQGSLLQHALFSMAFLLLLIAMGLIVIIKFAIRRSS